VAALILETRGRVLEEWPYLHMGQYAMVRRGGMTAWNLGRVGAFPIRMREPQAFPVVDVFRAREFEYAVHGRAYQFLLVRDDDGGGSARLLPEGAAKITFSRGRWRVYRCGDHLTPPPPPSYNPPFPRTEGRRTDSRQESS
jgi:hypothetical protein